MYAVCFKKVEERHFPPESK